MKNQPLGVVGLLFMSVWLTLWSAGVAFIQSMFLGEGTVELIMGVFVLTHGGTEVFVLRTVAASLRKQATSPGILTRADDVGGMRLSWRTGSSGVISLLLSVVLPSIVYSILCAPLVATLLEPPGVFSVVAVVFGCVWLATIVLFWVPTWRAQLAGLSRVTLSVNPHTVEVQTRGLLGLREREFPAWGAQIGIQDAGDYSVVELVSEGTRWKANVPSDAGDELRGLQVMLDEAKALHVGADVPPELAALRDRS